MTRSGDVLTPRALNRALLARQLLLERVDRSVPDVVEHLVGLQGQEPRDPHIALWSRLSRDPRPAVDDLLATRRAVRAATLRTTLHLQTGRDFLAIAPLTAPLMARTFWSTAWGKDLRDVDVDAVLTAGRALLAETPRTRRQLADALAPRWPDRDPTALAYAVTYLLPVVQVPPRGLWGHSHQATWAAADDWLADTPRPPSDVEALVLRYLTAFGPATTADVRTWSGVTGLRDVVEGLRPRLRTFRDDRGRELLDVPDAPLPHPDTPAAPRFLPEYDNVLLSHDDRRRVGLAGTPPPLAPGRGGPHGSLLVDGTVAGTWRAALTGASARLDVHLLRTLSRQEQEAVADEGDRLLVFLCGPGDAPGDRDVRVRAPR